MEVFCKKAILKTKMGSFFKKATVLRNICEPLLLYVVQTDIYIYIYVSLCLSVFSLTLSVSHQLTGFHTMGTLLIHELTNVTRNYDVRFCFSDKK